MADPVWYYARGDVERGPFTLPQIKALANASKLRPDDLVWKEGMEHWTAARDIVELFPPAGLVGEPANSNGLGTAVEKPAAVRTTAAIAADFTAETQTICYRIARSLTLVGVVAIVTTYGCETLGARRVTRLAALAEMTTAENSPVVTEQKSAAEQAMWGHQAGAFARGVALLLGLLVLLIGAIGLMVFADRYERWLGVGLILIVMYSTLSALTR